MSAEANKQRFLTSFAEFAAGNHDVLLDLLHEDYVDHSPGNPSGRDAFVAFLKASPLAEATMDLKRVIADDEYVVVHYLLVEAGEAVVDIWRFRDGKIAEHWDVSQAVTDPGML